MSIEEPRLRNVPVKTDAELIEEMGTNPDLWAHHLRNVMPFGVSVSQASAWFHHAIEAGRKAGRSQPIETPARSPAVWGASGFELRTLAVTARSSLARLREYIGFDNDQGQLEALELVDWLLGSTIEDPAFRDEAGR